MSRIVARLLVLLAVTLSATNAQCLTVCSLKPCAHGAPVPPTSSDSTSCHHKSTPKAPAEDKQSQGCAHQMLRHSPSEGAIAPLRASAPVAMMEPVHVSS